MATSYVDWTYYSGTYLGNAIAQADFPRLAIRASSKIDQLSFQRVAAIVAAATDTDTIDKIKMACCALAEKIQELETNGDEDSIQSESIGSNSVTFGQGAYARLSNTEKLRRVAKEYLDDTQLLFQGFKPGEYGHEGRYTRDYDVY